MPHFLDGQFKVSDDTKVIVETPVTIGEVASDSPASKAGLKKGDVVKAMRSVGSESEKVDIQTTEDLLEFNDRHAGSTVYVSYEREGGKMTAEVQLNESSAEYLLGAGISGSVYYQSSWSAPIVGLVTTAQITGETFKGVGMLFYNLISGVIQQINPNQEVRESGAEAIKSAGDSVSGPVGIIGILLGKIVSLLAIVVLWKPYYLFTSGFKEPVFIYWKGVLRNYTISFFAFFSATNILKLIPINPYHTIWLWIGYAAIGMVIFLTIDLTLTLLFAKGAKDSIKRIRA